MPFDYKKEYKEFYLPPKTPGIVNIPAMHFLAVRGQGDPNKEDGAYKQAIGLLYAVAFTIKMSKLGNHKLEGYFDYVVPPLEGLWWQEGLHSVDYSRKRDFQWIALIRLPEFVTKEAFDWAIRETAEKKKMDCSPVEFFPWKACVSSVCTSVPTTRNRRPFGPWRSTPGRMGMLPILAKTVIIMRSISAICGGVSRRNEKQ